VCIRIMWPLSLLGKYKDSYWFLGIFGILGVVIIWYSYGRFREGMTSSSSSSSSPSQPKKQAELILFWANWCPACHAVKPDWDTFRANHAQTMFQGYSIVYTEYDCGTDTPQIEQLRDKYHIEGYPTVILVNGDTVSTLDAKISERSLTAFLNEMLTS